MEPISTAATGLGAVVLFLKTTKTGAAIDDTGGQAVEGLRGAISSFCSSWMQRREENLSKCVEKAQQKIEDAGGATAEPNSADVADILDAASKATGEKAREMFANLLAAKFDKEKTGKAHPAFTQILEQMTDLEAHLVKAVYEVFRRTKPEDRGRGSVNYENMATFLSVDVESVQLCAENLVRLGVFDRGDLLNRLNDAKTVGFSRLGWYFAGVCLDVKDVEPYWR